MTDFDRRPPTRHYPKEFIQKDMATQHIAQLMLVGTDAPKASHTLLRLEVAPGLGDIIDMKLMNKGVCKDYVVVDVQPAYRDLGLKFYNVTVRGI